MANLRKWDFRDVSAGLQILRAFLLGREHKLHNRFAPLISPRTIPPPDIPRGPEYKYSKQYYCHRSAADSIMPPVVAPIAEGPPVNQDPLKDVKPGGVKPDSLCFVTAPTPGLAWWWDGHNYYDAKGDQPPSPPPPKGDDCFTPPMPCP